VPGAPLALHVIAKPTGAICNLDCEYCFLLSKEEVIAALVACRLHDVVLGGDPPTVVFLHEN
jgi:sulfatase maturation enzyme AslB (radical SAM superfamily)